jgi:hypothetical protein
MVVIKLTEVDVSAIPPDALNELSPEAVARLMERPGVSLEVGAHRASEIEKFYATAFVDLWKEAMPIMAKKWLEICAEAEGGS